MRGSSPAACEDTENSQDACHWIDRRPCFAVDSSMVEATELTGGADR